MVFYRLNKGKKLFSFNDEIGNVPILGIPLAICQKEIIEKCGGKLIDVSDKDDIKDASYYIFDEDLFFTKQLVRAIINIAQREGQSFRIALNENAFNDRFALPHSHESDSHLHYNFFYINKKSIEVKFQIIHQKIYPNSIELPNQIVKGGKYNFDQCDTFISRIASPFHLLQVNIAVNFLRLIKIQNILPQWLVNKYASKYSRLRNNRFKSLNKFGKSCNIHPSAIIENAILGDNVSISANAIVRHSYLGNGCVINDNSIIANSVLGDRTVISSGNHINLCLTFNEVFLIHGPYQFSVFGKSSAVFAVINCDTRLDQKTISIPTDVGMLDSHQVLLGIAYGHNSKVGGGNIIASGRIVPNDRIIDPPNNIILKFD